MGIVSWLRSQLDRPTARPITQPSREVQAEKQQARKHRYG